MPDNLETYVNKVFKQAKNFLQNNFPEIYEDIGIKTGVIYKKKKTKYDYTMEYRPRIKCIQLKAYEKPEKPKDNDIIRNAFGIKMRRKNSYLVSIIHELGEAMYMKELTNRNMIISYYDVEVSHNVATSLEMHALERLIEQTKGKDRQDFMRRKKARLKDNKNHKLKGV
ncbi:MAG: hypothetical protein Q8O03_03450 [Nanoarchaeota archaeon]|nr:hypothetical protein [Nanoarchaeota archaeon]